MTFSLCPQCETLFTSEVSKCSECGYSEDDYAILLEGMNGVIKHLDDMKLKVTNKDDRKILTSLIDQSVEFKGSIIKKVMR